VWVERAGRLEQSSAAFGDEAELAHAIERILAPLGRRVDEASPMCDARLPDGSRVKRGDRSPWRSAGPCLTIRKFRRHGFSLEELVRGGTLAGPLAEFLADSVRERASILVSGGTGFRQDHDAERALGRHPPAASGS